MLQDLEVEIVRGRLAKWDAVVLRPGFGIAAPVVPVVLSRDGIADERIGAAQPPQVGACTGRQSTVQPVSVASVVIWLAAR